MWLSYVTEGYRDNRHEVEARDAVARTREPPRDRPDGVRPA
jgi:hypothetical protein